MKEKLRRLYISSTLTDKIRYSYFVLLVPIVILVIFCFYNMWNNNSKYTEMLDSIDAASEFSLDFKKDFDYEAYLLIVENKSIGESKLQSMLDDAKRIVDALEDVTYSADNIKRLQSAKKYIGNLEVYKNRIEQNLIEGNRYETNITIWENDIQIVTSLLRETIFQYIYYEIHGIQAERAEYQKVFTMMVTCSVVASLCVIILIVFTSYYIPQSITKPIIKLSEITDQVAKGDLSVRSDLETGAEVGVLNDSLNAMIDKICELVEQVKIEQKRLRKAEFEILQAQINPHFLYNTLDAIVWLAESGEQQKVVSMVENLSGFFRTSLNQGKDMVSVEEELSHVKNYLEIQKMRYQDILRFRIEVPFELNGYRIPKITIQPLVENALYHGIKNKRGLGTINVIGELKEDYFELKVKDDGIGMTGERLKQIRDGIEHKTAGGKDIYGLYNVNERIKLNFGEQYGLTIESVYTEGTTVTIRLPYVNAHDEVLENIE
ncbi:MAG: sensor histidine kinase [Lachnospiraceae bacterium]|nr:sensor histidine kinase [Lachnospiraceae bacterium]